MVVLLLAVLLMCCTACGIDDYSDEHKPFISVYNEVKSKYSNIQLARKYMYGYGEYDILYTSTNDKENCFEQMILVLYEFDYVINSEPEFTNLLNGCYIRVEAFSGEWLAIHYRYDIGTEIRTNSDEDVVPTIKSFFPDTKVTVCKMVNGKPEQIEF